MRSRYLRCCGREIHVLEWGLPGAPPLIAWHGVARNAADFDTLGNALSKQFRTIAPDTVGRGLSQWSPEPDTEYTIPFYLRLASALFDELAIERAGWIGTSMGGIIGLAAGATLLRDRVDALFLNDITPAAPDIEGLRRIAGYIGNPPEFPSLLEYEAYLRAVYAPAGPRSDDAWRHTTDTSYRRLPNGHFTTHYDPAIARAFADIEGASDLWAAYDTLEIPVMLHRGERSDVASAESAQLMMQRGPRARVCERAGVGHAPWLETPEELDLVRDFFQTKTAG